jgi:predicted DNA binding protein
MPRLPFFIKAVIEAVLAIKAPEWINHLEAKYDARIRVLGCLPFAKGGVKDLVEISAPEGKLEGAVEELKRSPQFQEVDVAQTSRDKALASLSTTRCAICSALAGSECFLISASTKEGGIHWTLLASRKKPIRKLMERMRENGFEVEIVKMAELKGKEALTARQEEIIRIALDKGYFDYPKRTSLRSLAKLFGVSISTLSEVLRAGQKKIMQEYFKKKIT